MTDIRSIPGPLSLRSEREVRRTARTVVVPLANPDTAVDLLRTAHMLLGDDGTEQSRLIACLVLMDDRDSEANRELISDFRQLVEALSARVADCDIEFRTTSAPSVARGVLDTVRDTGADALVIGATTQEDGRLGVSTIGQSILDAVPCDVFVLGTPAGRGIDDVERVVVAVRDPAVADTAVRVGVLTSRALDRPLEVMHAREGDGAAQLRIRRLLGAERAAEAVVTTVPPDRLTARLADNVRDADLLVVGYEHGAEGQGWAPESLTRRILSAHDPAVLTVAHHPEAQSPSEHTIRRLRAWLHPRLTDVEQDSMRDMATAASQLKLDYMLMILLSGTIAALGLMLDSVAIIIGAMLVAPLMDPLQAVGIAVVDGRPVTAARAAVTVLVGSGLVVVASAVLGLVVGAELTAEIASRGAPSLLDAGVALAAGAAGAYATARKTIPAALAGVAIAAALVPPLAVSGLAAAMGSWSLSLGALLLSTVNIVCIAVTSAGVFTWLGLEAHDPEERRSTGSRYILSAVLVLVLALALSVALRSDRPVLDQARLASALADASGGRATLVDAGTSEGLDGGLTARVVVDVPTAGPDGGADGDRLRERLVEAAGREVADQLGGDVTVRLVPLETVSPD